MELGRISKWAVVELLCLKLGGEEMRDLLRSIDELKTEYDFDDFVIALMDTDISSYDKTKMLSLVPTNGNSALYSALISVVESNMSNYYREESVKQIVKRFEQGGR